MQYKLKKHRLKVECGASVRIRQTDGTLRLAMIVATSPFSITVTYEGEEQPVRIPMTTPANKRKLGIDSVETV